MKSSKNKFPFTMYHSLGEGVLLRARCRTSEMEIVEVTQGDAIIQIGTESVCATAGDFVYLPEGLVCRISAVGTSAIRGIVFDKSIIEANMVSYESEILEMFYIQSKNKIKVFNELHPSYCVLKSCMSTAYDEYMSKEVCYNLPVRASIYTMVTELLRYYCGSKDELDRMVYHNVQRLRPVIDYIGEHFAEKIYIEKLSEIIMVSADYFTKMFKESIGKTPVDYINAQRINRSMALLCETDIPVAEIAERIGFSNANYFHKIFKQYMETSPLSYRKNNKE